jgi:hypothetical protein
MTELVGNNGNANSSDARDRTIELMTKAHAILDLLRCAGVASADLHTVSTAAWTAQEMIEEANKINGWF